MRLYNGDCLEIMQKIPDESIDMILCDLPYGRTQNKWDKKIPFDLLWKHYERIIKNNGAIVLFCQQPFTSELIMSNPKMFRYCWVWYKHYTRGFLNAKKQPLRVCEDIAVFYKKQCQYFPIKTKGKFRKKGNSNKSNGCYGYYRKISYANDEYYPRNLLDFAGVNNTKLLHQTQKPVELLEYLIKTYTKEGETVLDNCMGSGSTGVACRNLNRDFIGIEKEAEFFTVAKERIEAGL